ncbi:T9SS type A sorting domain-containing protein [Flavobacterium silvaticum]|uniref:T9SS type A sorting domain-containing protein n=1 Tax=Flavobacterium silvaticum TaxID=1852020 RepID=A0A972FUH0_9FLAO|nr:T9SS type A sorting domain-containing protein [Flavobacterium silvaticum]NMH28733.1 T9SS type A sorting domain-containing protein [Flavobacterium silvaticum]
MIKFLRYSFLIIGAGLFAQAPANDLLANAQAITPGLPDTCVPVSGTLQDATSTPNLPGNCTTSTSLIDAWYSFVPTSDRYRIAFSGTTQLRIQLYKQSTPGPLALMSCAGGNFSFFEIGATYFIRVYRPYNGVSLGFELCVTELASVLENDECPAALPVDVSATETCSQSTVANLNTASQNIQDVLPCSLPYPQQNLWYSFVASSDNILIKNTLEVNDRLRYTLHANTCPVTSCLASGTAEEGETKFVSGLTAGQEYLLSVYSELSTSLSFCIATAPAFTNDGIENATEIVSSENLDCVSPVDTWVGPATPSVSLNVSGCASDFNLYLQPTNPNQTSYADQWLHFTALSNEQLLKFTGPAPTFVQVFGGTAGNLVCGPTVSSSFGGYTLISGLVTGTDYFIRLLHINNQLFAPLSVCMTTPVPVPSNDEPENAVELFASEGLDFCSPVSGTMNRATESVQIPEPACNDVPRDIWYTFVATSPDEQFQFVNTNPETPGFSYATSLYNSVDGGVGQEVYCYDIFGNINNLDMVPSGYNYWNFDEFFPLVLQNYTGLTVGETYYIRLYSYLEPSVSYHNLVPMTFDVCLKTLKPIPTNSTLETADEIPVSWYAEPDYIYGYTTRSTYHVDVPYAFSPTACGELGAISWPPNQASMAYYKFTATQDAHVVRLINEADNLYPLSDYIDADHYPIYISVYEFVEGELAFHHCSTIVESELLLDGLTPGKEYFVKVMFRELPFTTEFEFQIAVTTEQSLGIPDQQIQSFKLYPNPVDTILNLSVPSGQNLVSAEIVSVEGRSFGKAILHSGTIDVSELPSGIYFLKVATENQSQTLKFIRN